jgi:uncharacterized membrane protein
VSTRITLLAVLAILLALAGWYLRREWQKDACSDSGGEWNQSAGACGPRIG